MPFLTIGLGQAFQPAPRRPRDPASRNLPCTAPVSRRERARGPPHCGPDAAKAGRGFVAGGASAINCW